MRADGRGGATVRSNRLGGPGWIASRQPTAGIEDPRQASPGRMWSIDVARAPPSPKGLRVKNVGKAPKEWAGHSFKSLATQIQVRL